MAVTGLAGLRKSAAPDGLTQARVAKDLGISLRQYYRYEAGMHVPTERRDELADILGISRGQLDASLPDAGLYGFNVPVTQSLYISLEQAASSVWAWQPWTVHALLQTPAYAAAVERSDMTPVSDEVLDRRVDRRMARQRVLYRHPDPLRLSVVLDESVLRRCTGTPQAMAEQLAHLVTMADLPNTDIRVLPLGAGVHLASMAAFAMMASEGASRAQVVCLPDGARVRYDEEPTTIARHGEVFEYLRGHSLTATESVELIGRTAKETHT